jgi:hypothetical protein
MALSGRRRVIRDGSEVIERLRSRDEQAVEVRLATILKWPELLAELGVEKPEIAFPPGDEGEAEEPADEDAGE